MPNTKEKSQGPVQDKAGVTPGSSLPVPGKQAVAPTSGKKALGGKEVPSFEWKLVGRSGDYVLTLFKAVEKHEVEAQLDRLRLDGYYQDLKVLDINAKIAQPKSKQGRPSTRKSPAGAKPARDKRQQRAAAAEATVIRLGWKKKPVSKAAAAGKSAGKKSVRTGSKSKKPATKKSTTKKSSKTATKKPARKTARKTPKTAKPTPRKKVTRSASKTTAKATAKKASRRRKTATKKTTRKTVSKKSTKKR